MYRQDRVRNVNTQCPYHQRRACTVKYPGDPVHARATQVERVRPGPPRALSVWGVTQPAPARRAAPLAAHSAWLECPASRRGELRAAPRTPPPGGCAPPPPPASPPTPGARWRVLSTLGAHSAHTPRTLRRPWPLSGGLLLLAG
eukprot:6672255-Pyramimonas_sp.AAC.2